MSVKVTVPNTSSDSVIFGSANTPTAAEVVGIDSGSSNGQLAFNTTTSGTSTERMRIDSSGNVGIGTSSPTYKLQVRAATNKNFTIEGSVSIPNSVSIAAVNDANNANVPIEMRYATTFALLDSNVERMRIDSSGNVGIGTSSGTERFTVKSDNTSTFINIQTSSNSGVYLGNNSGIMLMYAGGSERMRIDSVGNTYVEGGTLWQYAPAPTAKSGAATLTAAELATGIITCTGTVYTLTLPTGTSIDSQFSNIPTTNIGFDFFVVSSTSGVVTIAVNTGVTSVGTLTITAGASAQFRLRRTAANTYVLYRLG